MPNFKATATTTFEASQAINALAHPTPRPMVLNKEQQEAVDHEGGPLLIVAGAGSGKTRVITSRILHLLESGVLPSEILALTFTNKAAREMKERIIAEGHPEILAITFHALGARILRESYKFANLPQNFIIYDTDESQSVLKSALDALGIKFERSEVKKWQSEISQHKNGFALSLSKALLPIYDEYRRRLSEVGAVDFDDLLLLPLEIFKNHPERLAFYQSRFCHILVDEYQDTNSVQYALVKALAQKAKSLCVVGDPDQSIYSWRGANIGNILHFERDFPGAKRLTLDTNYRSTAPILEAANRLIRHNFQRFEKKLKSVRTENEPIRVRAYLSDDQEALEVVREIQRLQKGGHPLDEIAILYRTNAQSRLFEEQLILRSIPYVIYGGLSFYQRKEVKDLLAFLRLVYLPSDVVAFERTFHLEKRGVGASTLAKIFDLQEEVMEPILPFLERLVNGGFPFEIKLSLKQQEGIRNYLRIFENLSSFADSPSKLLEEILSRSGYLDLLQKEDPNGFEERRENLFQLEKKAKEWESHRKDGENAQTFLHEMALLSAATESGEGSSRVQLMTLHNAKGLEFNLCFLTGMEEGLFPHANSLQEEKEDAIEEERRLCYVGITRARLRLIVTRADRRFVWGTWRTMRASRFLREAGLSSGSHF